MSGGMLGGDTDVLILGVHGRAMVGRLGLPVTVLFIAEGGTDIARLGPAHATLMLTAGGSPLVTGEVSRLCLLEL